MFDVGFFELLVIAIIALLVLGPERLPQAARMSGAFIAKVRRTVTDVKVELSREIEFQELQDRLKQTAQECNLDAIEEKLNQPIQGLPGLLSSDTSTAQSDPTQGSIKEKITPASGEKSND